MKVVAVDPGGVTGIATYRDGTFNSYQTGTYEETVACLINEVAGQDLTALVCEGFVITPKTHKLDAGAFNQTTDLIGACRLLAIQHRVPFKRHTVSEAKDFSTDSKLKMLGWFFPTPGGHRNDGARHLLCYLAKNRHLPVLELLTKETR